MRVIAGKKRGLKLNSPPGMEVRPTLDKIREAVFSSIDYYVRGADCLDLFAGSGAMGIEALSRGAGSCIFLDKSEAAIKCVQENLKLAGFSERVICTDSIKWLKENDSVSFDLVFIDPPYHKGLYEEVMELFDQKPFLKQGGILVAEHPKEISIQNDFLHLELIKEKNYGEIQISIYTNTAEEETWKSAN